MTQRRVFLKGTQGSWKVPHLETSVLTHSIRRLTKAGPTMVRVSQGKAPAGLVPLHWDVGGGGVVFCAPLEFLP